MRLLTLLIALLLAAPEITFAAEPSTAPTEPMVSAVTSPVTTTTLSNDLIRERMTRILTDFEARQTYADLWYYVWLCGFSGSVAVQSVRVALEDDKGKKIDAAVGGATSLLGVGSMIITPVRTGHKPLNELKALPTDTPENSAASLVEAERIYFEAAEGERKARKWIEHANGLLVSFGSSALLYWGFDRPEKSALIQLGMGLVFGQARVISTPQAARHGWEKYQTDYQPVYTTLPEITVLPDRVVATYRF